MGYDSEECVVCYIINGFNTRSTDTVNLCLCCFTDFLGIKKGLNTYTNRVCEQFADAGIVLTTVTCDICCASTFGFSGIPVCDSHCRACTTAHNAHMLNIVLPGEPNCVPENLVDKDSSPEEAWFDLAVAHKFPTTGLAEPEVPDGSNAAKVAILLNGMDDDEDVFEELQELCGVKFNTRCAARIAYLLFKNEIITKEDAHYLADFSILS